MNEPSTTLVIEIYDCSAGLFWFTSKIPGNYLGIQFSKYINKQMWKRNTVQQGAEKDYHNDCLLFLNFSTRHPGWDAEQCTLWWLFQSWWFPVPSSEQLLIYITNTYLSTLQHQHCLSVLATRVVTHQWVGQHPLSSWELPVQRVQHVQVLKAFNSTSSLLIHVWHKANICYLLLWQLSFGREIQSKASEFSQQIRYHVGYWEPWILGRGCSSGSQPQGRGSN